MIEKVNPHTLDGPAYVLQLTSNAANETDMSALTDSVMSLSAEHWIQVATLAIAVAAVVISIWSNRIARTAKKHDFLLEAHRAEVEFVSALNDTKSRHKDAYPLKRFELNRVGRLNSGAWDCFERRWNQHGQEIEEIASSQSNMGKPRSEMRQRKLIEYIVEHERWVSILKAIEQNYCKLS